MLLETQDGYFICVPFRSQITHNDAFLFSTTVRSSQTRSGLDYQKTVIINNPKYIFARNSVIVDNDEYVAMINNADKIVEKVTKYVNKYISHINGSHLLHEREFQRHYKYSTLQYFHDVLGI